MIRTRMEFDALVLVIEDDCRAKVPFSSRLKSVVDRSIPIDQRVGDFFGVGIRVDSLQKSDHGTDGLVLQNTRAIEIRGLKGRRWPRSAASLGSEP